MAKIISAKKRRGIHKMIDEAASSPETQAIIKTLENPGIIKKVERTQNAILESLHNQSVKHYKNRQISDYFFKSEKQPSVSSPTRQAFSSSTTEMIKEEEFLKLIGRGTKSSAANSAWVLRLIRNAEQKCDKNLFPSFKQIGRNRLYHLDSVKTWMAHHFLDMQ